MPEWLKLGLIVLAVADVGVALVTMRIVYSLSDRSMRLLPAPAERFGREIRHAQEHNAWAGEHGFRFVGFFILSSGPPVLIAAWQDPATARTFAIYYHPGPVYDLATKFSRTIALTTGNTTGGGMFPRPPGDFLQTFPGADLDKLWARHCDAEQYLRTFGRYSFTLPLIPFEERFPEAIREQMAYVRTFTLWPL